MALPTTVNMSPFPPGYGLILLEVLLICIQCGVESIHVSRLRRQIFHPTFMETNFPAFKGAKLGYPDMGQGRFSDKLSDEDWYRFNSAQRAHYNFMEGITAVIAALLISGLYYPRVAFISGIVYMIGRLMYGIGYRAKGPPGRRMGSLLYEVASVTLLFTAVSSCYQMAGGLNGITKFGKSFLS